MQKVRFGDVAERINIHVDQQNTDLEYYIGGEHIESCEFMIHSKAPIKGATIGYQFQFGFEPNDILFMTKNPHLRKASMVDFRGLCSIATFVIRTKDKSQLLQEYLLLEMQSDRFWQYLEENKSGGVNYFINWGTLSNYMFDLPDMSKQKELSKKVWSAYRVKEAYKKLLVATDEMVKSQFIEMFGDPMTNTKEWSEYGKINQYAQVILGTTPNSKEASYWDGDIKWITPAEMTDESYYIYDTERHITEDGVKSASLTLLPYRSVLFSTRAPIGKVGLAGAPMYCNQGFKNFICGEKLNPVYLYYSLIYKREYLISLGTGTTFKELSKKTVEGLNIAVPPIHLQNQFESIYDQADKSKFELRKSIEAIDQVIKSLIN